MKKAIIAICMAFALCMLCVFVGCSPVTENSDPSTGTPSTGKPSSPTDEQYCLSFDREIYELVYGITGASVAEAKTTVTMNGDQLHKPAVTYTVGDPSVAEVSESGIVTAKSAGYTTLTARYKESEETVPVQVYGKATSEQTNTFGAEYVNLFGRELAARNDRLEFQSVGSAIEVAFFGTSFSADVILTNMCYVRVFVDGEEEGTFMKLETKENFSFASELKRGLHIVRVVMASEYEDGTFILKNLKSSQFLTAPRKSGYKIEFIGDSITAGYGALGKNGVTRAPENSDVTKGYAYLTAQTLGVDYSIVALSGICVKAYLWKSINMTDLYKKVSQGNMAAYGFDDGVDMVVLNLGTNDASYINSHSSYENEFSGDYKALLTYIREKRPLAKIVCVYGNMGKKTSVDAGIRKALEDLNDQNIGYYEFDANTAGCNGHPSVVSNLKLVPAFAQYLQTLM